MTPAELKASFRGVLGFPISPFREDLTLDYSALEANVSEMASHPFCALVMAGGIAEVYSLTPAEIVESVRVGVHTAGAKMPVVGCVGFNTTIASQLARDLERAGADGLLVLPPYYVQAPEAGLLGYYKSIANSTGLPLILYGRDWLSPSPDFVARLADAIPTLIAWKDGQGDMRKLERMMAATGDRLSWLGGVGDDAVAGYFSIGIKAYTSSLSNVVPRLSLALADAALSGDFTRVAELTLGFVLHFYKIRDRSRGFEVAVTKRAMELLGKKAGPVRPPLAGIGPQEERDLRRVLDLFSQFAG
jgi:5-dehydro-4-deoxyglucarate dehydratase